MMDDVPDDDGEPVFEAQVTDALAEHMSLAVLETRPETYQLAFMVAGNVQVVSPVTFSDDGDAIDMAERLLSGPFPE